MSPLWGLEGGPLSPGYKHIAPLGLNASMHRLIYHVSCSVFYPVNPLILRILIQTIIMSTPQLMNLPPPHFFLDYFVGIAYHP